MPRRRNPPYLRQRRWSLLQLPPKQSSTTFLRLRQSRTPQSMRLPCPNRYSQKEGVALTPVPFVRVAVRPLLNLRRTSQRGPVRPSAVTRWNSETTPHCRGRSPSPYELRRTERCVRPRRPRLTCLPLQVVSRNSFEVEPRFQHRRMAASKFQSRSFSSRHGELTSLTTQLFDAEFCAWFALSSASSL
jgi:hypothetical protein